MMKLILMFTVAAGAVTLAPQPVAAAPCTDQYMKCLNDTHDLSGWLQKMADVECFAEYSGCVARSVAVL